MKLGVQVSFAFFLVVVSVAIGVLLGQHVVDEAMFAKMANQLFDSSNLSSVIAAILVVGMLSLAFWDAQSTFNEGKKEQIDWSKVVKLDDYKGDH